MSILDNEGHNPNGLGNTPSRMDVKRLRAALVEAARLLSLEQLQQLSEESVHVLIDLGLLAAKRSASK